MGGGGKQTVGYKYFVGMHMILCHGPADGITRITVDDKILWSGDTEGSASITIDQPDFFGGDTREGGIVGTLDVEMGGPAQTKNDYLTSILGPLIPAFRGVVGVVLRKMYLSMNPYMKPWTFRVKRTKVTTDGAPQWNLAQSTIVVTNPLQESETEPTTVTLMNPANVFYEVLTATWGENTPLSEIDEESFLYAANTFYTEGLGVAFLWDSESSTEDFFQLVQQHCDAVLYASPRTGKWKLKPIRGDYDVGTLPVFGPHNVERIEDPKRLTFGDLCTSVTVSYWDNISGDTGSVTVSDPALEIEQGKVTNTALTFAGFADSVTATKVANRELAALSKATFSCSIYVGQDAANLEMGDCLILNWPKYGVTNEVMRITGIAYGSSKSNLIKLTVTSDIYSQPQRTLVAAPPSLWVDPRRPPGPPRYSMAFELPYYSLVVIAGQTQVDSSIASNPYVGWVGGALSRPVQAAINGRLYTNPGSGWDDTSIMDFAPGAKLAADIGRLDTFFEVVGGINLSAVATNTWLQVGEELMAVVSVVGTTVTVKRGTLDTVPAPHAAEDVVLFWSEDEAYDPTEYVASDEVAVKMLTVSGSGVLPLADAATHTVNIVGRAAKPFPPADVQVNGLYWPAGAQEELVFTWVHRNRVLQTGGDLAGWFDPTITLEPGTTYSVGIYDGATELYLATGIADNTHTISSATLAPWPAFVRVEIWSTRATLDSYQRFIADLVIVSDALPLLRGTEATVEYELTATEGGVTYEIYGVE